MRTRTILAASVLFLSGLALCLAADVWTGNWKLNEAKSKFPPGAVKNQTVNYVAAGDNMKVIVDGVDKDGKAIHSEWTGKFDGKAYPVTGNPNEDTRTYTKVDDHTLTFKSVKGGKEVTTGKVSIAADGKTRTVTTTNTDSSGKKSESTAVFDKQQ